MFCLLLHVLYPVQVYCAGIICGRTARFVCLLVLYACCWTCADDRIRTTFPESQVNTLGMFYNGRTSRVDVSIHNNETEPITVHFIGGAFQDIATLKPIHNVPSSVPGNIPTFIPLLSIRLCFAIRLMDSPDMLVDC
jgi:hypothetical protein